MIDASLDAARGELDLSKARQVTYQGRAAYEVPIRAAAGTAGNRNPTQVSVTLWIDRASSVPFAVALGRGCRPLAHRRDRGLRAARRRRRQPAAARLRLIRSRPAGHGRPAGASPPLSQLRGQLPRLPRAIRRVGGAHRLERARAGRAHGGSGEAMSSPSIRAARCASARGSRVGGSTPASRSRARAAIAATPTRSMPSSSADRRRSPARSRRAARAPRARVRAGRRSRRRILAVNTRHRAVPLTPPQGALGMTPPAKMRTAPS